MPYKPLFGCWWHHKTKSQRKSNPCIHLKYRDFFITMTLEEGRKERIPKRSIRGQSEGTLEERQNLYTVGYHSLFCHLIPDCLCRCIRFFLCFPKKNPTAKCIFRKQPLFPNVFFIRKKLWKEQGRYAGKKSLGQIDLGGSSYRVASIECKYRVPRGIGNLFIL